MIGKLVLLVVLTGCQNLSGNWSGQVGSYTATFHIKKDNTGLFCYTKDGITKIKPFSYSDGFIFTGKGSVLLTGIYTGRIRSEADNFVLEEDIFYRDKYLLKASGYCKNKLKRLKF